jgi:hypothetical protein
MTPRGRIALSRIVGTLVSEELTGFDFVLSRAFEAFAGVFAPETEAGVSTLGDFAVSGALTTEVSTTVAFALAVSKGVASFPFEEQAAKVTSVTTQSVRYNFATP